MKKWTIAFIALGTLTLLLFSCQTSDLPAEPPQTPTPTFTPTPVVEPPLVNSLYTDSDENIPNPERGFVSEEDLDERNPLFSDFYYGDNTMVWLVIRLDSYREKDLPPIFLLELNKWLSGVRKAGIKAIIRFSYNDGPYPDSEPDASLEQILRHINQVTPVLEANQDVIAWVQAGFIGAWGEWHTSTHGLDDLPDAKREILFALLDGLPPSRMVMLRYPVDIMTLFPEPLTAAQAFSEIPQARVGFHNDCFLSSDNDENTFARDDVFTAEEEYAYLSQTTQYVPVGGESCAYNPPRSDCDTALEEMALFHYSFLNDGWNPEVLDAWDEQGCYDEISNRLGYRFVLQSMTANEIVLPGGVLNLKFKVENQGFASLINVHPLYLVLDGPRRYNVLLPIDIRTWMPDQTSTVAMRVRLPADVKEGKYTLALWIPDADEKLQERIEYSIQLATEDVWDEDEGYNVLGELTVTTEATGNIDMNASEFSILP